MSSQSSDPRGFAAVESAPLSGAGADVPGADVPGVGVPGVGVHVNGEFRRVTPGTLAEWLDSEGLAAGQVATAVNGEFVARDARARRILRDGDRIDVFRAIVGG